MSKVRIRKTGEIIDVICFSCTINRQKYDSVSYIDSKGVEHNEEHLNYYWDLEAIPNLDACIDWEQRRYEIAKDVLANIIGRTNTSDYSYEELAIKFADSLIKKLKEK